MTDITQLEAMNWKAKAISRGKLLERFRADMSDIVRHAENEGDRVYLGSTNHLDRLKDAVDEMERMNWDRVMRERVNVDPYAEMRKLRGLLDMAVGQLSKAHDDAFKQCVGYGLVTTDGREFSCMELNKCSEVADSIKSALETKS